MIHSLGSCDYLKIDERNHLLFSCQFYDDRQICVQEQYNDPVHMTTRFNDIYKVKVHDITLRELLLVQSLYVSTESGAAYKLVKAQPDPGIFLKVFLELDVKSLVTFLAFDNSSIDHILKGFDDQKSANFKYFSKEFPVFYRNSDGCSAIDVALEQN